MGASTLKQLVEQLSPDLQKEVVDFAEFLLEKRMTQRKQDLKLDYRGVLRDMREEYTSVELQHKVFEQNQRRHLPETICNN